MKTFYDWCDQCDKWRESIELKTEEAGLSCCICESCLEEALATMKDAKKDLPTDAK